MQRQMGWLVGLAVVTTVAAGVWLTIGNEGVPEGTAEPGGGAGHEVAVDPTTLTPDQVRSRLFEQQAQASTQGLGNWCVQGDALQPCLALRERFDYYIDTLGQEDAVKLRTAIAAEARKEHGDKLAADIMQIWEKYWRLRTHTWQVQLDPADTRTWKQVYDEQTQARRQILGDSWAKAFFDADEKQFLAYYEQIATGRVPSAAPPSASVPTMTP